MALTPSTMLPLGTLAPSFSLPDTDGKIVKSSDYSTSAGLLVMFICNHCPYVKHIRSGLAAMTGEYMDKGLAIVGIMSNDVTDVTKYQDDRPELMAVEKKDAGYRFPYLYDESQAVAKAYQAACTPDFFLFDGSMKLVYRGQMDDSRPGNSKPVTGADLRAAMDAIIGKRPVSKTQIPAIGCNIKWRPGSEPSYFSSR